MIFGLIKKIKEEFQSKTIVTVKKKTTRKKRKRPAKLARLKPSRLKLARKRKKIRPAKNLKLKLKPKAKSKPKHKVRISLKKKSPGASRPKESLVGRITHFFPKVNAAVIIITRGKLSLGDTIRIVGPIDSFVQQIKSMQINRTPIKTAKKGDEIGLEVLKPVDDKYRVYRLNKNA